MDPLEHGPPPVRAQPRVRGPLRAAAGLAVAAGIAGCASPAPPRPPSLRLPAVVRTLTAERTGDIVTLRFALPQRTTDNLPLRERALGLRVCRELEPGPCDPVAGMPATLPVVTGAGPAPGSVVLTDTLRGQFAQGPPRLMGYRVELANSHGRAAGFSEPAWIAAGSAPAPVTGFAVSGSRLGVLLTWQPSPPDAGRILFERESLRQDGAPASPGTTPQPPAAVLLRPDPAAPPDNRWMLDTGAAEQVPYRYTAFRERDVRLEGHVLTQRSERTPAADFTLRDVFPPPAPTDLTAAPFFGAGPETANPPAAGQSAAPDSVYAVDLIWQPVEDTGLAGYNIYRQPLSVSGQPEEARVRLNASPVPLPGFHDTTAVRGRSYRWSVTAVDRKGNESAPATTEVDPAATLPPPLPLPAPRRRPHGPMKPYGASHSAPTPAPAAAGR